MFYCPNCNNIYDITKNITSTLNLEQTGGQISDTPESISSITTSNMSEADTISLIIKKILNGDQVSINDIKFITLDALTKHPNYKKLQGKNKELILNRLSELSPSFSSPIKTTSAMANNAFFLCKNCGNFEPIKPSTLLIRKLYDANFETELEDNIKFQEMAQVKCLPITRNYICPNKKCPSLNNFSLRSARFYRIPGSFRIRYVCISCEESWTS